MFGIKLSIKFVLNVKVLVKYLETVAFL